MQYLLVVLLFLTASCHRHHPGEPEVINVEGTTSEENGIFDEKNSDDSEFNGPAIANPTKTVDAAGTVDDDSDEYDDQDVDDSSLENSEDNMRQ